MAGTYLGATEITSVLPAAVSIGTDSTPINLSEVASWVQAIGARANAAAAAAGYVVPVSPSTADAYAQMQEIVRDGVTCRILRRLAPANPDSAKKTIASDYCEAFDAALKALREGDMPLVGAAQSAGTDGRELPRSWETSGGEATLGGASPVLSTRDVW